MWPWIQALSNLLLGSNPCFEFSDLNQESGVINKIKNQSHSFYVYWRMIYIVFTYILRRTIRFEL
jgi:hypothetical protein